MEGPAKRVWVDRGHRQVCVLNDKKYLIVFVPTGQWLVVKFRCEPMKKGLVNSQIRTHTHLHSDYKLHKNISDTSECEHVRITKRTQRDHLTNRLKTKAKKNKMVELVFFPSLCEKSAL